MEQNGSTYKVPLTTIREILNHPNADKLEIAVVYGFNVIIKKGQYKVGDTVLYVPIDSIIPQKLEDHLFPPESKIKLNKHRIRQIRIRQIPSQGLLISPKDIQQIYEYTPCELEKDYSALLGIVKYEPPEMFLGPTGVARSRNKKGDNPNFHKYNGLDNIKWYPEKFKEDEIVVIQEKIHGTNARAGWLPYNATTFWKKLKKWFGFAPKYEFCYGSNNVQLQDKISHTGFYGSDVYGEVFEQINAKNKIKPGETIFGEIYGYNIQKNYSYGCNDGERKFVLFDVKVLSEDGSQRWLNPDEVASYAKNRGFEVVPELYRGFFNLDLAKSFTKGDSVLCPAQKVREGVVVKSLNNYDEYGNKRALKIISEDYLDKDQTEYH